MSMTDGIKNSTANIEINTPFASTAPMSKPIVKSINIKAINPAITVQLLAIIAINEPDNADVIAWSGGSPFFCSSR